MWRMTLLGIGLGPLQGLYGVAIQNAAPVSRLGVVTSASQFFRQIGSTVGVAIFGTLVTNVLNERLALWAASMGRQPIDLSQLRSLAIETQAHVASMQLPDSLRIVIADSVTHVFTWSLVAVLISLLASMMIPELPMRERSKVAPKETLPADAPV
jgi:hypothetical protein